MKGKFKFNIIDVLVIVIIVAVAAFIGVKMVGGNLNTAVNNDKFKDTEHSYEYTFHCYEAPDFVLDYIKNGANVLEFTDDDEFGKLFSFSVGEAEIYEPDSSGHYVKSTKPDHSSVDLVVRGKGVQTKGGVKVGWNDYSVGHSLTINVGNAKLYCKISGIKRLD